MIDRVRRSKTGTYRAIGNQHSYISNKVRIVAWPQPEKIILYQRTTYEIAEHHVRN